MERKPVNSSNIASVGYDENSEILEIEFKDSGVYQYFNVPQVVYEQLVSANSAGKYFNLEIKDKYAFSRA